MGGNDDHSGVRDCAREPEGDFLWAVMDRAGLRHWQEAVATVLNRYIGVDEWCEADYSGDGIDWLIVRVKKLTPPVSDSCFANLLLAAPILSWSVAHAGRRWNVMELSLDEFLGGMTPEDDASAGVNVWQDPAGAYPSHAALRNWLCNLAGRARAEWSAG